MVEVQQTCFNSCLVCSAPAVAFANPWKWHKLCQAHESITDSAVNCLLCQNQVKIIRQKSLNCDYCDSSQGAIVLECNHYLCINCNNRQSDCLICENKCSTCKSKAQITFQNCRHLYCHRCRVQADKSCVICKPIKCYLCRARNSRHFEKLCESCIGKCFICNKDENIKEKLDCEHILCNNCAIATKNYCSLCQKNICNNCKLPGLCNKSNHIICRMCLKSSKEYQCILCQPDQRCNFCNFVSSTKPCHKGTHKICIECDIKIDSIYCKLCPYKCCVCNNLIEFGKIIQYNCGHEICESCYSNENKPNCSRCPRTKDYYTCIVCRHEFWNKEHKIEVIKCLNCNERICTVCGNKVSYFRQHECKLIFLN